MAGSAASPLQGVAYHAAGQAATALHAMATLQVYQAQALKHLHKGGPDQGVMQELRAATDFALRATKVMSTVVVQERHLWLTLAQMADVDKARFLDAPISQGGLFGNTFSAVQKQTEVIKHILPRRDSATTSPGPQPPPARRRGRPPAAPKKPAASTCQDCSLGDDNTYVPPPGGGLGAAVYSNAQMTVRLGYAIQYRGVLSTTVHSDTHAAVLCAEVAVLLAKDAIEPVPPAEMKSGFYSSYFIVPKKSGGLRPILDLRALNRSLLRLPFKMLTTKRMLTCIRRQDWFAAIDLKDAYFHVSILPRHRPFLRFAFEVLPFGLSLSPRVFTKVTEAALSPLWRMGIRILNYLDDWLLIAHSRDLLCEHRDLVLRHLSHGGLQVNREKSKLLHDRVPRWAWHCGTLRIGVSPQCCRLFSPWPKHLVVYTDASSTGWGTVCNGQAASGSWTGPRLQWHITCLELLAVHLALRRFRPMLRHKHMLPISTTKVVFAPSDVAEIAMRSHSRRAQPPPILENGDSTP
ncbi:hypothetical protein M9458_023248, partial [Cirrhinus mrigala]